MKRFILFTFSILLTFSFAIAQDGINYQGAATDANGDELTNQSISIRASVLSGGANGNLEWEETHSATTDQFGLFNVVIGQGTNTTNGATALFDDMDWGSGNHFLKIEMDATGGTNYAMIGTTQMMSVPYALYAKNAGIDSATVATMINNAVLQQIGHGDYYQGGVVAYLFQPGDAAYVAGEVHGYLAYYDGTSLGWGCLGVTTAIGVNNTSVGQGPVNTQQLVNTCTEANFAAKWCNDLVIGGHSDWFLPNVSELYLLHANVLSTYDLGTLNVWTSEESVVGVYGCTGGNNCCSGSEFANDFSTNGSSPNISVNRKMPGGPPGPCQGWGDRPAIAFRQF